MMLRPYDLLTLAAVGAFVLAVCRLAGAVA